MYHNNFISLCFLTCKCFISPSSFTCFIKRLCTQFDFTIYNLFFNYFSFYTQIYHLVTCEPCEIITNMTLKCTLSKVLQINVLLKKPTYTAQQMISNQSTFPLKQECKKCHVLLSNSMTAKLVLSILFIFILGLYFKMVDSMTGAVDWRGFNYTKEVNVQCCITKFIWAVTICNHI